MPVWRDMGTSYCSRKKHQLNVLRALDAHASPHGAARVVMLAAAGLGLASAARGQTVSTWLGGSGDWMEGSRWSPAGVPNGATFDVLIDGGNATNSVVTMTNSAVTIGALTVDAGDELILSSSLTLSRDSIING